MSERVSIPRVAWVRYKDERLATLTVLPGRGQPRRNDDLVNWAELLLSEARSGVSVGMLAVLVNSDGNISTGWVGDVREPFKLAGALDTLKREFMDRNIEGLAPALFGAPLGPMPEG